MTLNANNLQKISDSNRLELSNRLASQREPIFAEKGIRSVPEYVSRPNAVRSLFEEGTNRAVVDLDKYIIIKRQLPKMDAQPFRFKVDPVEFPAMKVDFSTLTEGER